MKMVYGRLRAASLTDKCGIVTTLIFMFMVAPTSCFARTITREIWIGGRDHVEHYWQNQYMSRETISDQDNLPAPSQDCVDSWRKKNLSIPYPPRFTKTRQTRDEQQVWARLSSHYSRLLDVSNRLELVYVEYVRYGLNVKSVNDVCSKVRAATQVKAWKDSWERTTRVREKADAELKEVIQWVIFAVDGLFEPLVAIKKNEFDQWAKKNPQAAMNIMVKRRLTAAERRAEVAEQQARDAAARASAAEARAAAAEWRAEEAEQNAGAAINAARGAINAAREARGY